MFNRLLNDFALPLWQYITPHFLAFASPVEPNYASTKPGSMATKLPKSFRNVIDHFSNRHIKVVVRLNKKLYSADHFTECGIEHRESTLGVMLLFQSLC